MTGIYANESFLQAVREEHQRKVEAIIRRRQLLQTHGPRPKQQTLRTWWTMLTSRERTVHRQQAFSG